MSTEGQAKPAEALIANESIKGLGAPAVLPDHPGRASFDAKHPNGDEVPAMIRKAFFTLWCDAWDAALASPKQSAAETKTEPILPVEPPQELEQFICNCDIRSRARYTRDGDNDFPDWKGCYRQMRAAIAAEGRGVSEQAVPDRYELGYAHGIKFADENLTAKDMDLRARIETLSRIGSGDFGFDERHPRGRFVLFADVLALAGAAPAPEAVPAVQPEPR